MSLNKVIISAPFGNYLKFNNTTSTLGTYTVYNRGNLLYRICKMLQTIRYFPRLQAWINKLGLPNPGIETLTTIANDIISIYGFNKYEWVSLSKYLIKLRAKYVELNLSCPNINGQNISVKQAINLLLNNNVIVIAKLPPIRWLTIGKPLYELGIRYFHLCNSMPTPGGGLSGKPLMQYSIWAIEEFREKYGNNVVLIGGGGITSVCDANKYFAAGANHIAIGSMLLNPLNWNKINTITLNIKSRL